MFSEEPDRWAEWVHDAFWRVLSAVCRRIPGSQFGYHDRRRSPPDRLWQHDGEPLLPVDLVQTAHQNHELWLAQIRSGHELPLCMDASAGCPVGTTCSVGGSMNPSVFYSVRIMWPSCRPASSAKQMPNISSFICSWNRFKKSNPEKTKC